MQICGPFGEILYLHEFPKLLSNKMDFDIVSFNKDTNRMRNKNKLLCFVLLSIYEVLF